MEIIGAAVNLRHHGGEQLDTMPLNAVWSSGIRRPHSTGKRCTILAPLSRKDDLGREMFPKHTGISFDTKTCVNGTHLRVLTVE